MLTKIMTKEEKNVSIKSLMEVILELREVEPKFNWEERENSFKDMKIRGIVEGLRWTCSEADIPSKAEATDNTAVIGIDIDLVSIRV